MKIIKVLFRVQQREEVSSYLVIYRAKYDLEYNAVAALAFQEFKWKHHRPKLTLKKVERKLVKLRRLINE